jgi:hypothetical protein
MFLVFFILLWVWLGFRCKVYKMATHLFCLAVSIYAAVMTTPFLLQAGPVLVSSRMCGLLFLMVLGGLVFGGLECFFWRFFLRYAVDFFGSMLDRIGGIACGLLFGYILWGFLLMMYCMAPISRWESCNRYFPRSSAKAQAAVSISWVCDMTASMSLDYPDASPKEIISGLMELQ